MKMHTNGIFIFSTFLMPSILQKGYQIGRWLEQPLEVGKSGPRQVDLCEVM